MIDHVKSPFTAIRLAALTAALCGGMALASGAMQPSRPARGSCLETSPAAEAVRAYLAHAVAASDEVAERRRAMWQLPSTADTAQIRFESDSATCRAAAAAHAAHLEKEAGNPPGVHVIRITPDRYVVFNFSMRGPNTIFLLLDAHFAVLREMIS